MQNKIDIVDIMKGISILMIVLFHIIGQLHLDLDRSVKMLSYQGVNVFFLLSGFTLFLSLNNNKQRDKDATFWRQWIKTKFFRLSVSYYIVLFITLFLYLINLKLLNISILSHNTMIDFALHFTYLHIYFGQYYFSINPAFWFMGAIALFYLFVPFLYHLKNKYIYIMLIFLLVYFYSHHIYIAKPQITLSFLFFIFGILASYYHQELQENDIGFKFILVLFSFILTINFLKTNTGNAFIYLFISFISVISMYMTSVIIDSTSNKSKFIAILNTVLIYLGKISFPIYLIHWGLIKPVFTFTNNYYIGTILFSLIVIFLSTKLLKIENFIIKTLVK